MLVMYALPWSPPSERASWALRARGVRYQRRAYIPSSHHSIRIWRATKKASVPVGFADGVTLAGSTTIARYADAHGARGSSLFFDGDPKLGAEIDAWDALADEAFRFSRDIFGPGFASDGVALRAVVDPLPLWARPIFPLAWRFGAWSFRRRYEVGSSVSSAAELRSTLETMAARHGGRDYLVGGRFSYADIAVAGYLFAVRPAPFALHALPAPIARHFLTVPEPGPWDPLFRWRDEVLRKHRE